jgi:CrcB protein
MNWFAVFLGGGAGSVLRFLLSNLMPLVPGGFPFATLLVNLLASLLLGMISGLAGRVYIQDHFRLFFTTGLCGGFSTFSTFSQETFRMWQSGLYGISLLYMLLSLIGSVLAFGAGTLASRIIR